MATLLPNPKIFSAHSLLDSRSLLPHSSPRLTLATGREKPIRVSSISFRRRRECGISFASRPRRWTASTSSAVDPDDVKEDYNNDDEEVEEEEGDEDFVPLREMKRWLQNKPAGFGEGKTYDTTVEENILEEFERSKKNQPAKKGKPLVSAKENAGSVDKQEKQNVTDAIKSDNEVRVGNLPKKRNIDRDLWKAFKEFHGITTISPAVSGNKKTRDPVCRGFAFVGFESGDAAYRFVQKYSKQNLLFGKVQKQISCDIVNGNSALKSPYSSEGTTSLDMAEHRDEVAMPYALEVSEGAAQSKEDSMAYTLETSEGAKQNMEDSTVLPTSERAITLSADDTTHTAMEFENSSLSYSDFVEVEHEAVSKHHQSNSPVSSDHNRKKIATKKGKTKPTMSSKLRVPGSLARLKIKERAVLTGAFSKYGEAASSTSSASSKGV